jgi:glycosyltransferase involved in cell wall biosynthesis
VVIPCHDKTKTLPLTVDTVLRQSVAELEVILLGDGVTDEVRLVIEGLVVGDPRVRFLDFPKGPHHGEKYRHEAILAAGSDAIFYLCDDDLLLPEHLADLLQLLEQANFAQSFNGCVLPDGRFSTYAADLADPRSLAPMLRVEPRANSVSITGTAHSRSFYLAVGAFWDTTPAGEWPDHFQWRRMMRHPDFRGATSTRLTAVQLPTSAGREAWTQDERVAELARWHAVVTAANGQEQVNDALHRGALADLVALRTRSANEVHARSLLETELAEVTRKLRERDTQVRRLRRRLRRVGAARGRAQAELTDLRAARSWRLTAPFRAGGQVAGWLSARRRRG